MKIKAYISNYRAVKAGSNECDNVEKEIDVTQLTPEERTELAAQIGATTNAVSGYDRGILDLENLRTYLQECIAIDLKKREELAADKAARLEKLIAFLAARKPEISSRRIGGERYVWEYIPEFDLNNTDIPEAVLADLRAWHEELQARNTAAEIAALERVDARKAAEEAQKKAELAARNEWIEAHGSKRLKLAGQEGIECWAIYRDERLALERPGWRWSADYIGEYSDPRNPPLDALEDLIKARKVAPDAKLAYWEAEIENDEDENETWRGYCAVAHFLDREIVFGLPNDLLEE